MYDELVKRLMYCRNNAAIITDEELVEIAEEAADAIEELSNLVDAQLGIIKQYQAYLQKSTWIPVTERLPEEYVDVLCYCSRNGQYGCGKWSKEDNGTVHWIGLYGMIPTHWMPLPQPPKEET